MPKIIIVDDHLLFAEGLAIMLSQSAFEVVGICTLANEVSEYLINHEIDLILLDVNLGTENGIDYCKSWIQKKTDLKIIAISMHHEYRYVSGMYKSGAKGYVFKNCNRAEVLEAIETVLQGGIYYNNEVTEILITKSTTEQFIELNPKEKKVLAKVSEGKTSRQIAKELLISIKTVEFYRGSLLIKFDAKNSIELINKTKNYDFK